MAWKVPPRTYTPTQSNSHSLNIHFLYKLHVLTELLSWTTQWQSLLTWCSFSLSGMVFIHSLISDSSSTQLGLSYSLRLMALNSSQAYKTETVPEPTAAYFQTQNNTFFFIQLQHLCYMFFLFPLNATINKNGYVCKLKWVLHYISEPLRLRHVFLSIAFFSHMQSSLSFSFNTSWWLWWNLDSQHQPSCCSQNQLGWLITAQSDWLTTAHSKTGSSLFTVRLAHHCLQSDWLATARSQTGLPLLTVKTSLPLLAALTVRLAHHCPQ